MAKRIIEATGRILLSLVTDIAQGDRLPPQIPAESACW